MVKVIASFLKGDSSAVSEEVYKRACNKIPRKKKPCERNVDEMHIFLKETYEMLIISFQPPPAKKKKWSKSDLIVNCERMCCRWL